MDYPRAEPGERQGGPGGRALTTTEAAVLGHLSFGELSGYDLTKSIETGVGMFWAPARSGIYAVLPRLVTKGLATRRAVRQSARPDKHVYAITDAGHAALRRWLESGPSEPDPAHNPLLLRVFFGAASDPGTVARHVAERRRQAQERLGLLAGLRKGLVGGREAQDVYRRFVVDWGLEYYEAVVRWADATLRELAALEERES
ncbi:MAG TPA: PadR family transcriptional regulator [Gaiellaceae bacterium]|nr:PadR family transcriptional regulator [Gaiellaceae bacterium]